MALLTQHIETVAHPDSALTLSEFLDLLRNEEDYFTHENKSGTRMLSHLRKIFYGTSCWDRQLIRGAADIPCRYLVRIVNCDIAHAKRRNRIHTDKGQINQRVEVLVREDDWMDPDAGSEPLIYIENHQEVVLTNGLVCDLGHVLAGMDAISYPEPIAPLPDWLMWMYQLVPHIDSNINGATWIGDLSSICGEIFFYHRHNGVWPDSSQVQMIIDEGNPAADMLGNIDSLVIRQLYSIDCEIRISEILDDYYARVDSEPELRYQLFCKYVGISIAADGSITNREKWVKEYLRELKSCTAFYVASRYSGLAKYWYAVIVWIGWNKRKLLFEEILDIQIDAIQKLLKK